MVLRCKDCVTYNLVRYAEVGVTDEEFQEVFAVGLAVGDSLVVPHLRRAMPRLQKIRGGTPPRRSPRST